MFCIVDTEHNHAIVKSGFKTASQANNWAKKNLGKDKVKLWSTKWERLKPFRYFVRMK